MLQVVLPHFDCEAGEGSKSASEKLSLGSGTSPDLPQQPSRQHPKDFTPMDAPFGLEDGEALMQEFLIVYSLQWHHYTRGDLSISEVREICFSSHGTIDRQGIFGPPIPGQRLLRSMFWGHGEGNGYSLDQHQFDIFLGRFHGNIQVSSAFGMVYGFITIIADFLSPVSLSLERTFGSG